jgi:hypothetical protein
LERLHFKIDADKSPYFMDVYSIYAVFVRIRAGAEYRCERNKYAGEKWGSAAGKLRTTR